MSRSPSVPLSFALLIGACAPLSRHPVDGVPEPGAPARLVLRGARVAGIGLATHLADVRIEDGRITAVGSLQVPDGEPVHDLDGAWLVPAFIDSHVHLAYEPAHERLLAGGVAAAVDLGAPIDRIGRGQSALRVLEAGPMITSVDGYPLDSWGRDGYGTACRDAGEAVRAVDDAVAAGAGVIKIPVVAGDSLPEDVLIAVVARAHELGLRVAAHALGDAEAALAARVGADVLAHVPVEALSAQTVAAWSGRAVISTLTAFGASAAAIDNLARLRAGGVRVLYGTDLGNTHPRGIDAAELAALGEAGLDGAAIVEAGTAAPAAFWGWSDRGLVAPGRVASFVVLGRDPSQHPGELSAPREVWIDGVRFDTAEP